MLRSLLRAATAAAGSSATRTHNLPKPIIIAASTNFSSSHSSPYSSKSSKKSSSKSSKAEKPKSKSKSKTENPAKVSDVSAANDIDLDLPDDAGYAAPVFDDPSLDIRPNGLPLFTPAKSISELGRKDVCTYMDFSLEDLNAVLVEGLPAGMTKEFEETKRSSLIVRQSFLELRDNFRRVVDPPLQIHRKSPKVRKQIVLDGPVSCGKSISLAMLVHWARSEGWLVFYVPKGREWTHGGFFLQKPTSFWSLGYPYSGSKILQDFLKYNESRLQQLPCQNFEPIPLGEGAGVGLMKGVDSMVMPEGSTLFDLIQTGLAHTNAAVGVVVRLRKELSLVKDIPVLIAIDQYNSWFTFSEYEEPVTRLSCRPIHARELSTVNAFRSMMHGDMMVGAFSHSTAVGKLRQDLPDVPLDARVSFPRYSIDEAATVCHYYLRQRLIRRDAFSEEKWKKVYYLSNGNGSEMRSLVPHIQ